MELIDQFYNRICCQAKPQYPDPYTFAFGKDSSFIENSAIFQSNQIKTTKYNALNFFPKSIINQYKRMANLYFLTVACITTIPGVTPLNPALIWLPLVLVLLVSIIKEAYQDYHRYKVDKQINNKNTTIVLRNQDYINLPWSQIAVGDICLIKEDEAFPADLLLLSTGQDDGIAYIQTGTLDGEKTSKIRYGFCSLVSKYKTEEDIKGISGTFNGEIPTLSLDHLRGTLIVQGQQINILDNKQLLYRGAKLKNTQKVWGLVLYTGQCTKIMLNTQISSGKITGIEKRLNILLVSLFICQIIICIIMTVLSIRMQQYLIKQTNFLSWGSYSPSSKSFIKNFMMFFIDYSSIIPISLIVSIEIAKLAQSYFIDFDKLMYCEEKQLGVLARNTALNQQLGQIQYVFTDKTGTLTSNKMTFHSSVIGDLSFQFKHLQDQTYFSEQYEIINKKQSQIQLSNPITLISDDKQAHKSILTQKELQHNYLMALLTCNAINAVSRDGKILYQSQSPDQIALIKFAQSLKYIFIKRQTSNLLANIKQKNETIKILEKFSFTSERKRMSVLIQYDKNLILYTKGADNVITERIKPPNFKISEKIEELSKNGLRTLMVAMKVISPIQYAQYTKAMNMVEFSKRDHVRDNFANKFESNLELIGATALLDQLQIGVPQTLRDFQRANIRVWMLTGDKLQTAIQVSKSCHLIQSNYKIIQCKPSPIEIGHYLDQWENLISFEFTSKFSLVIEGSRLGQILSDDQYSKKFAFLSQKFATVICCRLLPIQKAQVVKLIRTHLNQVCLAIGDGGNDVSMIKQAHIGIGLYGEEGMSAVQASDYAIPQFRMIWRLIFVHGRWNYLRISEMILYFTYKSLLFTIPKIIFSTFNGYSGQPIFDDYYIALYNILFTSLPLLIRALFQQDVNYVIQKRQVSSQENSLSYPANSIIIEKQKKFLPKGFEIDLQLRKLFPKIYFVGKNNQIFNLFNCFLWIGEAALLGTIMTLLSVKLISSRTINKHGYNSDLWMVSIAIYSIVIIVNTIKISMHVRHWTGLFLFSVLACSLAPYLIYMWISNYSLSKYVAGTVIMSYQNYLSYFIVVLVSIVSIVIISLIIYLTFHRNKMLKRIRLRMLDIQSENQFDSSPSDEPLQKSSAENNCKIPFERANLKDKVQFNNRILISPEYLPISKKISGQK